MRKRKLDWVETASGCWNCISHKPNKQGYPGVNRNGKAKNIGRFIYEECFGEMPPGMVTRHKCDNRLCMNPEHLEIGTPKDNTVDMINRKRCQKGSDRYNHLFEKEDLEIIKSNRISIKTLMEKYHTSRQVIWRARVGKTYA